MPGTRLIKARDLVHDIHLGMTDLQLMAKYQASEGGIRTLKRKVLQVAKSKFAQVLQDIRSGMNASQLMERYTVSSDQLQRILVRLKESGLLAQVELCRISEQLAAVLDSSTNKRQLPRNYPILPVKVYDENNPDCVGMVVDLTEQGIGVAGLSTQTGAIKTLVVMEDQFYEEECFKFEARCRWVSKVALSGEYLSGFQIVKIDRKDLARLRTLIRTGTYQTENLQ